MVGDGLEYDYLNGEPKDHNLRVAKEGLKRCYLSGSGRLRIRVGTRSSRE